MTTDAPTAAARATSNEIIIGRNVSTRHAPPTISLGRDAAVRQRRNRSSETAGTADRGEDGTGNSLSPTSDLRGKSAFPCADPDKEAVFCRKPHTQKQLDPFR